jgi:hypothetical protein
MVYNLLRPRPRSVMSTTMVIVTTTLRVVWVALPPIQWRQAKSRLFITDLSHHRRRPYPSALRRKITLMCPGERFLHGGKVCAPSVSYLLALSSMTGVHPLASMLYCRKARGMLYRAAA